MVVVSVVGVEVVASVVEVAGIVVGSDIVAVGLVSVVVKLASLTHLGLEYTLPHLLIL